MTAANPDDHHVVARFGRDTSEVARARETVRSALGAWGLDAAVPEIELAVSELVSNGLRHGRGHIEMQLRVVGDRIRLAVSDQGGGRPVLQSAQVMPDEPGGWGLQLVAQLSDDWGSESRAGRTTVWMERRAHRPESPKPDETADLH